MSFAWFDYLALAEALLQGRTTLAPEEACCRAAISRAYYAVYGVARTRAREQEGLQLPATGAAHQRVIAHYFQRPSPLHRAIGENLRRLRGARNRADDDDQLDRPVTLAQSAVQRARTLMAQLQALTPTPSPPADAGGPAGTADAPQGTEASCRRPARILPAGEGAPRARQRGAPRERLQCRWRRGATLPPVRCSGSSAAMG